MGIKTKANRYRWFETFAQSQMSCVWRLLRGEDRFISIRNICTRCLARNDKDVTRIPSQNGLIVEGGDVENPYLYRDIDCEVIIENQPTRPVTKKVLAWYTSFKNPCMAFEKRVGFGVFS